MKMLKRALLMAVCAGLLAGMTASAGSDGRDELYQRLMGFVQKEPLLFDYGDYDGDGAFEAFAVTGEGSADEGYSGDIWFVSPLYCDVIQTGGNFVNAGSIGTDGAMLFAAEGRGGADAYIWGVYDGFPVDLPKEEFAGVKAGMLPGEFFIEAPGSGDTAAMRYFFGMEDLELREFGAISVAESVFRRFDGAVEILEKQSAQGKVLVEILCRANHVIHLNYLSGTEYSWVTVRYDNSSVTFWEEGKGVYMSALRPENAEYPFGFEGPSGEADQYDWPALLSAQTTAEPTAEPTAIPLLPMFSSATQAPTAVPTAEPTAVPTAEPTAVPTAEPVIDPVAEEGPETYGMTHVKAHVDLEARAGAGAGFARVATVKEGDVLEYLDMWEPDRHGALWYGVLVSGEVAWVSEDCVHFVSDEEAAEAKPTISSNSISRYAGSFKLEVSSYFTGNINAVNSSCAMDSDLVTAWNSNNRIEGEWLKISVRDGGRYEIGGLRIAPGYWKNRDVYGYNSRPRTVEIYCDNQFVQSFVLNDAKDYQTLWFDEPVVGSSVKIVIADGYRGSAHKDLCITEVELLGAAGTSLSSGVIDDWGTAVRKAQARVMNGKTIAKGDYGMHVVGVQLLLRDGFGVLSGNVDGSFGSGTQGAVETLAARMRAELPDCEPMRTGVVDAAYWRNMMAYMDLIG